MRLKLWIKIALVNLVIVAGLGLLLRAKMLFSMPFVEFKNVLHAHSHYAFSGWVSIALLSTMIYQLLPQQASSKKVYQWLLGGLLAGAVGMLLSFPVQGYGLFSIGFSTLFILVTYAYSYVFLKDFMKAQTSRAVRLLTISALACLVISSVGPFTLAYLLSTKTGDVVLSKNAIYTYLHLQYSGFFTLAVLALGFHRLAIADKHILKVSRLLVYSVLPSLFSSYLWSYPGNVVYVIAIVGSALSIAAIAAFFMQLRKIWRAHITDVKPLAFRIGAVAVAAFTIKMVLQALTIIPAVGLQVFANRPVIIGFLHLVLLGFISIGLLAHFVQSGLLKDNRATAVAIWIFIGGVAFNELVLMVQGLGFMLMLSSAVSMWLLFAAAICLLTGATLIVLTNADKLNINGLNSHSKSNFFLNHKIQTK